MRIYLSARSPHGSTRTGLIIGTLGLLLCQLGDPLMASDGVGDRSVDAYFLLIDTSASMNEIPRPPAVPVMWKTSKLGEVQRQLAEMCDNMPTESSVRVFVFDEGSARQGPQLDVLGSGERASLRQFFSTLRAEGQRTYAWRSLDKVLTVAGRELLGSPRIGRVRILMYTDGEDNDPVRPNLRAILERHQHLLQDGSGPVQVNYLTLGFTLSAEMRNVFAAHGVEAIASLRPEDVIPLIADFAWTPERPLEGDRVQFIDRSSGVVTGHAWTLARGYESADRAPTHQFEEPGSYPVTLTVRGSGGRSQTVQRTVVVAPLPVVVPQFAAFPDAVKPGEPVLFRNQTGGPAVRFAWDFGDGQRSTEREPTHRYSRPGTYSVMLAARNRKGETQSNTVTNAVRVAGPSAPVAAFVLGTERPVAGDPVRFISQSRGEISRLDWWFPGRIESVRVELLPGADATTEPVLHHFHTPGDHEVRLVVIGPGGEDEFRELVHVFSPPPPPAAPPLARFEVDQKKGRTPLTVRFRNLSEGTVQRFVLDFGDGSEPFTATNFVDCLYVYEAPGRYRPNLRAEGTDLFQPSTHELHHELVAQRPPSWLARHVWGLLGGMGMLSVAGRYGWAWHRKSKWIKQHQRLKGHVSFRPARPVAGTWTRVAVQSANGTFRFELPERLQQPGVKDPVGVTLHKRLDATRRREVYTLDLMQGERVMTTMAVRPGSEADLAGTSLRFRYDS